MLSLHGNQTSHRLSTGIAKIGWITCLADTLAKKQARRKESEDTPTFKSRKRGNIPRQAAWLVLGSNRLRQPARLVWAVIFLDTA